MRISRSFGSSFGVVPDDTSEWKPEIAPQAMVMKTKGNSVPLKIGPVPSMNWVIAGILTSGAMMRMDTASMNTTPSFRNVDR